MAQDQDLANRETLVDASKTRENSGLAEQPTLMPQAELSKQETVLTQSASKSATSGATSSRAGGFQDGGIVGGYKILRKVGQGGMGAVYEAEHSALGKRVAIKTLLPELSSDPEIRARFIREGQSASKVRHPNVVDVYDVGELDSTPYLVMEFLEGESLRAPIAKGILLSYQETSDILIAVLSALGAAHDKGVIHRDLKPDNVFLCTSRRGHIEPKIVDFGISKVLTDQAQGEGVLTGTAAMLGTPYYMSPEQAKNAKDIDGRSDQYSASVMAYEAVTGKRPFHGDSLYNLMTEIVSGERVSPSVHVSDLPDGFCEAILRAMHPNPAFRFPTVRDFAQALLPYATDRVRTLYAPELSGSVAPPALGTPPKAVVVTGSAKTGPTTARELSQSIRENKPASKLPYVIAAAGVCVVAMVTAGLALRPKPEANTVAPTRSTITTPTQIPSATSAPSATAANSTAIAPKRTRMIRSTPSSVEVYRDGALVGHTPYAIVFESESEEAALELKSAGYLPVRTTASGKETADLTVELKPQRKAGSKVVGPSLAPR